MIKLVINKGRIPIKLWTEKIEEGALKQAINLSNLPFAFSHIAIMPDVHEGFGMPIGAVAAFEDVVIPHAVGVDIGCGMHAIKTILTEIDKRSLQAIVKLIKGTIPVGFEKHKTAQNKDLMPKQKSKLNRSFICFKEYDNALYSLGTLGGGNHFIEIQKGSDGFIWIMIHSGSRNLGKQIADHYNNIAKKINEKAGYPIPPSWELAYLETNSLEGQSYLEEMHFAIEYAKSNRKLMANRIVDIFEMVLSKKDIVDKEYDVIHNYASYEKHFSKKVWVHRKGAIRAFEGDICIIPGSQGSKSYIATGKGNPDSFKSSSHGAGRVLSRHKARKNLSLTEEIKKLNKMGIIHSLKSKRDLDEAPSAYKDISEVINNQLDLIEPVVELTPLAVIKG
ncbi:RtcB family protein [Hippea jasoniae]|uniref:RtcB family protein n=1 Tax=Hippea jasoniae TaxID=944479 RepID=UPI000557C6AE|nr:RtcB family protein [Hippea jasoniae]